jgi:hypothetical protein
MEIPTEKLLQRLRNITQLVQQTEQQIASNIEVQKSHPERIANVETWLRLANDELGLIREEDEVGVAHWDEISEALPTVIDRLNNQITIQRNFDFILATDQQVIGRFLRYVLEYGTPLFKDVMKKMSADEFTQLEDLVDMARRDRV